MSKKLSDIALAKLAREYKAHKTAADAAAEQLRLEVQRRGVPVGEKLELHGVRLRHKQWRRRRFDIPGLKKLLPRRVARMVVVESVDAGVLDELVKLNEISAEVIDACFDGYDEGATYVDVQLLSA